MWLSDTIHRMASNFLSVIQHIWSGITSVVNVAAPYESTIAAIPVVGGPAAIIIGAILAAEKIVPQPGNGAAKKTAVTALVNAAAPGITPATLSQAIDELVAALNAVQAATAKLPATIPTPA